MVWRIVFGTILLILATGLYFLWQVYDRHQDIYAPPAPFMVIQAPNANPQLTIVEFLHYGCVACHRTHKNLVELVERNPDLRLIVRPVPFEPETSTKAAEYAIAAGVRGKFNEMNLILTNQHKPYDETFYMYAAFVTGIDRAELDTLSQSEEVRAIAASNARAAQLAGVKTTPAVLVGKTLYQPEKDLTLNDLIRMVQAENKS